MFLNSLDDNTDFFVTAPIQLCRSDSCSNGGKCVQNWNEFICDCSLTAFVGKRCRKRKYIHLIDVISAIFHMILRYHMMLLSAWHNFV